jgi:methionyl-tRNA formyltransferase
MKIIFFTQEDPFYVKAFFDEFLRLYAPVDEIKAIVLSRPMGKKTSLQLARQMYDFYGLLDFLRMGTRYAFVKLMQHRNSTRSAAGGVHKTYTIKQLATAYGIDVIERSDLNGPSFLQEIGRYDADLFISVACPIIFKKELIKLPRLGCINIHNAPLPKYRGMLPNFWQLYHNEKESGITVHKINAGIDTGDIIAQRFVPIQPEETLHSLILKTKRQGAKIMIDVIDDFRHERIRAVKMSGTGSYFTFPSRKEVLEFKQRGRRLL